MKIRIHIICAAAMAMSLAAGCGTDGKTGDFEGKLYLTSSSAMEEILFLEGKEEVTETRELSAGIPFPAAGKITGRFTYAPELYSRYNMAYGENAVAMDPEKVSIPSPEMEIAAGNIESLPVSIEFRHLETLDEECIYVAPVMITDVDGIGVLESRKVMYFVFRGASLINVVAGMSENRAYPVWKTPSPLADMGQFTLEALVNCSSFAKGRGDNISSIMGIEGKFLVRLGDASLPANQLQIATSEDNISNRNMQIEAGKWYHLAVTFDAGEVNVYIDGKCIATEDCGVRTVNFSVDNTGEESDSRRFFWIGYSYEDERWFDGYISEVRIWNLPLDKNEINAENHFYTVPVDSDGLVAYWKFNEGEGDVIMDHTANGNNLKMDSMPEWLDVEIPEK